MTSTTRPRSDQDTDPKNGQTRSGAVRPPPTSRRSVQSALAFRLSVGVGALMAVAAATGLVVDDLYQDPQGLREMFRGYDLVTLVGVVPSLLLSMLLARRGSARAQLVWLGTLGFAVYDYALYVFGAAFNDLFLVHVAILSLAAVALTSGLATIDARTFGTRLSSRVTTRVVPGILGFLAVGLGAMWIFYALRFAITGATPAESDLVVPIAATHLGYALDLAVLVPAYATAAVLLWRRAGWGYPLAGVLLIAGIPQQVAYMVALVFQARADVPGATWFDPGEPLVIAAYLVGTALLLWHGPRSAERR